MFRALPSQATCASGLQRLTPRRCGRAWGTAAIRGWSLQIEGVREPLQTKQIYFSPEHFILVKSLLPQFTHCKNQHNLSSGGKGADFSLVFFSFSFWLKQQLSLSHLKKKVGKGENRGPNCKFESKYQRGRSLKG